MLEVDIESLTARGMQELWDLCCREAPGFKDNKEETGNAEAPAEGSSSEADNPTPTNNTSLSATSNDGSGKAVQSGPDSGASLSSTLEDLHVYLANQESLIQKLEQRCGAIEANHEAGARELEKQLEAAEKTYRSRVTALERQVKGLAAELSGLKRGGTLASAPGLIKFLKRKRD